MLGVNILELKDRESISTDLFAFSSSYYSFFEDFKEVMLLQIV